MLKKIHQNSFFARFDPAGKSSKHRLILLLITLAAMLLGGLCLGLLGLYFATGLYKMPLFDFYCGQPMLILLNSLPYLLIALLIWFCTNRAWIGFLSGGAVCLVYSFAEYWKLMARDDPIFAEDLTILKEALQMSGSYVAFTWQMGLAVVLVLLGAAVFFLFFRGRLPHFSLRIALPAAVVAVSAVLYSTAYTSASLYETFPVWEELNPWFQNSNYVSRGGIYPFIYSIQSALPQEPEGYSAKEAEQLLAGYATDEIPAEKQVSVVYVMYEAYADLSKDTALITGGDPYAPFHQLQQESYHGELVTNVFAGGTINTERCVLTGYSELTNFRRSGWSYARYFKEQGYVTEGSHAGYEAFYNRKNVNQNLGIDTYRFIENYFSDLVSWIPQDEVLLPEISRLTLEQMEAGEKVFSFNVTYQNHGPYDATALVGETEYVPKGTLSDSDYYIINNYLNGVYDTGLQMANMVDSFRDTEEPVVLVFFGDHKPWLGESSVTYTALGIDIFTDNDESFYNHYNTEYMIWANDAAKQLLQKDFSGQGPTISPCYLMNLLFEQCGWAGPSYLKLSNEVRAALPVVTIHDRFLVEGALVTEATLSEKQKNLLEQMRRVQFYLAQDSGGSLPR